MGPLGISTTNGIDSREVAAWEAERNASKAKVNWRFSTPDARIKLRKLYPSFDD